jgi:hypothetical protein
VELRNRALGLLAGVALCAALAGCTHTTQTTSGRDFIQAYPSEKMQAAQKTGIDAEVRAAAAVEPLLRFPARIGLARIGNAQHRWDAQLTGIPEHEAAAWQAVSTKLGPTFGTFVPVSPLVAEMMDANEVHRSNANAVIRKIRLAAARQHLDAVIIYESDGTADASSNPLSIGEWTLIGALILPSQDVEARGVAQALLVDVRNGYPYGTAQAEANDSTSTVRVATGDAKRDLAETVRLAAVKNLAPEVEKMMRELRTELAEKREARRSR